MGYMVSLTELFCQAKGRSKNTRVAIATTFHERMDAKPAGALRDV